MHLTEILNVRRLVLAGALSGAVWCGQAHAQVLDQVPADALAVLKIKSLEKSSAKVAKLAKSFGLDELAPEMKDPLGSVLEKAQMTKGIDKAGEAALIIYPPAGAGEAEPEPVALIPVSDYDAFVGNFKKADAAGGADGVTAVKDPDGNKTLYVAHRGKYALVSDRNDHMKAGGGIKLSKLAAEEADTKDAVFFFNMPVARGIALPAIKDHRKEMMDELDKTLAGEAQLKPFAPVFDTIVNHALDTAVEFLSSADAVIFSFNITDNSINGGALIEFKADSKMGTTVAKLKAGDMPLLAGLPHGKYFLLAGGSANGEVVGSIAAEWLDPVIKGLNDTNTDAGKKISAVLETAKSMTGSVNHSAVGLLVPTKPMGQESLVQQVEVAYGDAKTMADGNKKMLTQMNDLMAMLPQSGAKTSIVFGDPKSIDGTELTGYATKMDFDKNDPNGMQAAQILGMIYGPNGQAGEFGAVNDKTFLSAMGVSDEVLKEAVASAKSGKDVLSDTPGIKAVSAEFPKGRSIVYYVALDNIITTALRYAQGFGLTVKMKLPDNLPPVGFAIGTDGSSIRFDSAVPMQTVQALISAGLQGWSDMQGGAKGGL